MLAYIGMQYMDKFLFDTVHETDVDPNFYKETLSIYYAIPSTETRHQCLDPIDNSIRRGRA